MKYNIKFTQTAKNDLRDIAIYIAEQSKEKSVATKFVEELQSKVVQHEEYPLSGAYPSDRILLSQGYRFLVHKDYLIFYTVNENLKEVYIEAVFNSKKDYMRVLKKMI